MNKDKFLEEVQALLKSHGFEEKIKAENIAIRFYEMIIMSNPFIVLEAQKNHDDYSKYHTWPC